DAHHLLGHIERLWREHRAKHADDEVKSIVLQPVQIGCIAFLKLAVRKALRLCPLVSRRDEVLRDIDPQDIGSDSRRRECRRSVAAAEIQDLEPLGHSEFFDERLSALPHAVGDAREVAFFPKRLVWIHASAPSLKPSGNGTLASVNAVRWRSATSARSDPAIV